MAYSPRGVGRRADRGAFQDDGGADHRRAAFVGHAALHGASGVSGRGSAIPPRLAVRTIFSPLTSIFTLGSTSAMIEAMLRLTAFTRHPFVGG